MASPIDKTNREAMENAFKLLEEKLEADVFVYYGGLNDGVESHVRKIIEEICKDDKKRNKLCVI
ncbi:MAG: hypothetical protein IIX02_02865, partial [Clostridia bacterium]|nr:hypothetical protein [Clostridia bacterium]